MQEHPIPLGYTGEDLSIPDANASVVYPIADFMPHVVAQEDDLIVIINQIV